MTSSHLGSLFQPDPSAPPKIAIRQGVVQSWDSVTGENSVQIAGGTVVNIPSLTAESAELVAGDVVAVLTSGDTALVLGKVTTPGDPGTVPTWNADLTALAPLADLAAVTTGTTMLGVTNVTTDPGDGAHVVVNDPAYPGEVVLYSGNANELTPARIRPVLGGANFGKLEFRSAVLNVLGNYAYVTMESYDDGHATAEVGADDLDLITSSMTLTADTLLRLGDGADYLDVVGDAIQNANLSSLTNTFPTFPYYHAYLNASVAITTSGTAQKVTGWVADGSPNNSEITHSSGNFTVPRDGRYRLRSQDWWAAVASPTGVRTGQWVKNPSTLLASHTVPGNSATVPMPVYVEKTVRLVAGDQVFHQVIQGQANGHQLIGSTPDITYAQIEWVGP